MAITASPEESVQASPELADMFKAGLHLGYTRTRRHPKMRPFIFGTKSNVEVFDLARVLPKLTEALEVIKNMAREDKTILFVGTKACGKEALERTAKAINMPYVNGRWIGGSITNFKVILERIQYWQELKRQKEVGELKKYTKHEQLKISQEIDKLQYVFGGIESLKKTPNALFVIDLNEELLAVKEAIVKHIPIIALSSSDTDPSRATYPIPANDNSRSSIEYVLGRVQQAFEEGAASKVLKEEPKA